MDRLEYADAAAKKLIELMQTPNMTKLHFEFDIEAGDRIPRMFWKINALGYDEEDEPRRTN